MTKKEAKIKPKPATIPMILRAQRENRLDELVPHVYWHHDYKSKDAELLWGKRLQMEGVIYPLAIYRCYLIAKRYVYTNLIMVKAPAFGEKVFTARKVQRHLEQGYKITGIILEDISVQPKRRFSDEFLAMIAKQIWDRIMKDARYLKQKALYGLYAE